MKIATQSFLIHSSDDKFIELKIKELAQKLEINSLNMVSFTPDNSFTINEARGIKKVLTEKPFGGGNRLVVIRQIEKATPEAANALLKTLEEPPPTTFIVLTTTNSNKIIPTILSRCQVISEINPKGTLKEKTAEKVDRLIKTVISLPRAERMDVWPKYIKSKDEAVPMLQNIIIYLDGELKKGSGAANGKRGMAIIMAKTGAAMKYLESNVNYKAVLDILFWGFPSE